VKFGGRRPPFPDADLIRSLAALLGETGLSEIEYAVGERRIRVSRAAAGAAGAPAAAPALPTPAPAEAPAAERALAKGAVTAPMVGTVYLSPQPGAPPFVRPGEEVGEGQPVLIIEAMKVMNQIRAPIAGRVAEILVTDAQPVEYGALLLLIE
jgi:acetyl-CoA carboxylase biotin carboxyl carrier protein